MTDRPDIVMLPPLAALLALVLTALASWLVPLALLPAFGSAAGWLPGAILTIAGFGVAVQAARAFGAAGTNVDPTKPTLVVVQHGPYRWTRNPMYVGLLLVHFGLGLVFSLDWTIVTTPLLWVFLHRGVVLREEAYLTQKFGDNYRALVGATRRWF